MSCNIEDDEITLGDMTFTCMVEGVHFDIPTNAHSSMHWAGVRRLRDWLDRILSENDVAGKAEKTSACGGES